MVLSNGERIELDRIKKASGKIKELEDKFRHLNCQLKLIDKKASSPDLSNKCLEEAKTKRKKIVAEQKHIERQIASLRENIHSHKKLKPSYKKWHHDDLKKAIVDIIDRTYSRGISWVPLDNVAYELRTKKHLVEQIFRELNQEGKLSQAVHNAPHDSVRNPMFPGGFQGYQSDLYHILK